MTTLGSRTHISTSNDVRISRGHPINGSKPGKSPNGFLSTSTRTCARKRSWKCSFRFVEILTLAKWQLYEWVNQNYAPSSTFSGLSIEFENCDAHMNLSSFEVGRPTAGRVVGLEGRCKYPRDGPVEEETRK